LPVNNADYLGLRPAGAGLQPRLLQAGLSALDAKSDSDLECVRAVSILIWRTRERRGPVATTLTRDKVRKIKPKIR
jgi:hypothetical protein